MAAISRHYPSVHECLRTLVPAMMLVGSTAAMAQNSFVEIGLGYNSEDSYWLGQYSGLTQQGGFAVGGFALQSPTTDNPTSSWDVSGQNLGLESRSMAASYDRWGSFSVTANYDQIPHYQFNDARTPFNGSGTAMQTLPSNWVGASTTAGFANLSSSLKQVNIDKNRERYTGAIEWQMSEAWQVMSEFRHETKQGNDTLGAIFGSNGGNPRGAILARPIDYQTDEMTLGLSYFNQKSQYNLSYSAMLFSNKNKDLQFSNPFNNPQWASGANYSDGAIGQFSSEPDNSSSQFSFSGVHRLGDSTRLSGSIVSTKLVQDDSYLQYSQIIPAATPLPRLDLDGRVDSLVATLNFSTRLSRRTSLRLRYNYRERDNKTPQDIYLRIPGDAAAQGSLLSANARINRIYDLERDTLNADLNYRLNSKTKLSAGYELQQTDRTMVDVASNEEDTGFVKANFTLSATASGSVKFTRSQRRASDYDSTVPFTSGHNPDYVATLVGNQLFENDPLLRRFHLTDRDRDEVRASLNFYPTDTVGLNLMALVANDDYPDATTGLQESEKSSLAADLSYTPDSNWTSSIYYNYDNYANLQRGFARRGGGNPTPFYPESVRNSANNWATKSEDDVYMIGAGVDWELMAGRLNLSLDTNYTDARTETSPSSTGLALLPFPDVTTEITSVSMKSNYQLQADREISFMYIYERYRSADWSLDGTGVNTLPNILLLGTGSPEYSAHIVQLSLVLRF